MAVTSQVKYVILEEVKGKEGFTENVQPVHYRIAERLAWHVLDIVINSFDSLLLRFHASIVLVQGKALH